SLAAARRRPAEQTAENAADDLAADLGAGGAGGALRDGADDVGGLLPAVVGGLGASGRLGGGGGGLLGALREALVGGLAVDRRDVVGVRGAARDDLLALGRGDRRELRARRIDEGALDHAGGALLVEQRDQRLADGELE